MHLGSTPIVFLLALVAQPPAGQQVGEDQIPDLLNEQIRAVELYRDGRAAEAFQIFDRHSPSLNERLAGLVVSSLKRRLRVQVEDVSQQPRNWTPELVHSLAALHMEAALRVYEQRGTTGRFRIESRSGARLFAAVSNLEDGAAEDWTRWILAIGTRALSDGQLWWASLILGEACEDSSPPAALLVACGCVHEAIGALPAHILLTEGHRSATAPPAEFGARSYQDAQAKRRRHLGMARRFFEAAVRFDARDPDARIRLAQVHLASGEPQVAAEQLETLLEDQALDRRGAFLVRLFLGRARQRLNDLAGAVTIFRQALAIAPSAQSAHVALAAALHRQGKVHDAATATRQMFETSANAPDPWTSYYYGQFWIAEPLLAALRSEARAR